MAETMITALAPKKSNPVSESRSLPVYFCLVESGP